MKRLILFLAIVSVAAVAAATGDEAALRATLLRVFPNSFDPSYLEDTDSGRARSCN
ncbi:hypothetical protein [Hydrogenophaga sp.]|uniref:hypothetical protein n=1 Tax=Hydrogenophaga sp. TaxID=1904254 RepID=UPI0025B9F62F|nr:hypothetical protein [Hydrogenophaga sp.]